MRKLALFLLGVMLFPTLAKGTESNQTPSRLPYIGLRTQGGVLLQFIDEVDGLKGNPWAIEVDLGWHTLTEDAWQYCFCYPRVGAMLTYYNYSKPNVLGEGFGFVPYIEPFLSAERALSVSIRSGVGLAYLTKPYHPESNPNNLYYSTHVSFLLAVNIGLNYRISPQLNLNAAAYFSHISNGSISQPNRGIDSPMASLGFDYSFTSPSFPSRSRDDYHLERRGTRRLRISPFLSLKETNKDDDNQYSVFGLGAKYSHLVGRVSAVTGGVDWIRDGSIRERIRRDSITGSDHNQLSVTLGHELLIGKFNFYQELGVYLYAPFDTPHPVYQRYGLELFVTNNISIGANLKAHLKTADFLDVRVTYSF